MPTLGTSTKPSSYWHAYGPNEINLELEKLTAPSRRIRILELGQWVGGWLGTCRMYLGVWALDGTRLGRTAQFTVANEGAGGPSGGNVALYTELLEDPVDIAAGASFYVGLARHPDDGHQTSGAGTTSGPHYELEYFMPAWPDGVTATGLATVSRRIGAYVADYEELPGAYVRRSGAWVDAEAVYVRRSGAWVDASTVQVRRGSAWQDSE